MPSGINTAILQFEEITITITITIVRFYNFPKIIKSNNSTISLHPINPHSYLSLQCVRSLSSPPRIRFITTDSIMAPVIAAASRLNRWSSIKVIYRARNLLPSHDPAIPIAIVDSIPNPRPGNISWDTSPAIMPITIIIIIALCSWNWVMIKSGSENRSRCFIRWFSCKYMDHK